MAPARRPSPTVLFPALALGVGAAVLALAPPKAALLVVVAGILCLVAFLNTEITIHLIILAMLLSPEAIVGAGGVQFGKVQKGGQAVFRLEDVLLVIAGLSWLARTAFNKELGLFLRTPLNKPIAAYAVANVLATTVGVLSGTVRSVAGFFFVLKYLEYFVLYFMMVNNLRDEAQLRRFLCTGFATCAIASVIGILQIPSGERVASPFEGRYGEPNTFGGYLLFMLALLVACWLQSRTLPGFAGWSALILLALIPFAFTLSRASYLGAIPLALLLLALSERKLWVLLPLAILVIAGSVVLPTQVVDRIAYTYSQPPMEGQVQIGNTRLDTSTSARLTSFKYGLEGWTKRPLLGYGVTGFAFMDAQYVRTLTETGILGLAAFLWLAASIFRTAWTAFKTMTEPLYRGLAMGYLAGFAALLAHGIGANTFIIVRIMEPFWFFTAIVMMLPTLVAAPVAAAPARPRPAGGLALPLPPRGAAV